MKMSNSNILDKSINKEIGVKFYTCDLSPFFWQFGKITQVSDLLEI